MKLSNSAPLEEKQVMRTLKYIVFPKKLFKKNKLRVSFEHIREILDLEKIK